MLCHAHPRARNLRPIHHLPSWPPPSLWPGVLDVAPPPSFVQRGCRATPYARATSIMLLLLLLRLRLWLRLLDSPILATWSCWSQYNHTSTARKLWRYQEMMDAFLNRW